MDVKAVTRALKHTAVGIRAEEAAVWLLDQHGHWLPELVRCHLIAADPEALPEWAEIAWELIPQAQQDEGLYGTGSEWQILTLALALNDAAAAHRMPEALTSLHRLDVTNRRLALHAMAWAAGGRAWADSLNLLTPLTSE